MYVVAVHQKGHSTTDGFIQSEFPAISSLRTVNDLATHTGYALKYVTHLDVNSALRALLTFFCEFPTLQHAFDYSIERVEVTPARLVLEPETWSLSAV